MFDLIETLLGNVFFLLLGMLFYLMIIEYKKTTDGNVIILALLSSIVMVMCMSFPIHISHGFIFDLRYIPFIIGSLFGGFPVAIPIYAVLNIYRLIIGGPGWVPSFFISSLVVVTIPFLHTSFLASNDLKKIVMASGLALFHVFFYVSSLSFFFTSLTNEFYDAAKLMITMQTLTMVFLMALLMFLLKFHQKTR
ncbi:hypothetical protein M3689_08325 [Alkalihalophilus marmarensis]|jgi:two-component system sporulation sensor kinase B|uniref:LytS/YhcK type 5TM receptor domain-containing protein n=1 Tax=Alkalihalophilus marmarensis TaxID=521377 RepID=UPI00203F380F|nr:LytS/YhcK type 5TM receptor domain-containing protein [Alkalihalophilus marmarensis]MCM3489302.1 hypothetical protein [Alkalihalophilus marmarensis]